MKILKVVNGYPPFDAAGTEAHADALARELTRRGHSVAVFFRIRDEGAPDFSVRDLDLSGIKARAVVNNIRYGPVLERHYQNALVDDLFENYLLEIRPDVVHIHHAIGLSSGVAARAAGRGVPCVLTLHDYWHFCHRIQFILPDGAACSPQRFAGGAGCVDCGEPLPVWSGVSGWGRMGRTAARVAPKALRERAKRVLGAGSALLAGPAARANVRLQFTDRADHLRRMAGSCGALIAPSHYVRDLYLECGFQDMKGRIVVWPHGIECDGLRPPRRSVRGKVRFGYVGGLFDHKGVPQLIEAFRRTPGGAATLTLFGGTYIEGGLQRYKSMAAGLPVDFAGPIPRERMGEAYDRIDVLVVPSVWPETFCLSAHEALARGIPVVASRIGALAEAVRDGVNGLLFSAGDVDELSEKLRRFTDRPERVADLSGGIRPERTVADYVDRLEGLYKELIENKAAAGKESAEPAGEDRGEAAGREDGGGPEVSVVILTRNGGKRIEEVLKAVFAQETRRRFEVLVLDTQSADGTDAVARSFPVRLHQVRPEEFEHGATRNLGVSLARGRHVVLLTQDATPQPGWLDALADCLEGDPKAAGAFSRHLPRPDCNLSLRYSIEREWPVGGTERRVVEIDDPEAYRRDPYRYAFFANTSSIVRREAWERFPFRGAVGEDVDWARRVLEAGWRIVYEPASRVLHSHQTGLTERMRANFDHHRSVRIALGQKGVPTFRAALKNIVGETGADLRYFRESRLPPPGLPAAAVRAVAWRAASNLGAWLGSNFQSVPIPLQRMLSKLPPSQRVQR